MCVCVCSREFYIRSLAAQEHLWSYLYMCAVCIHSQLCHYRISFISQTLMIRARADKKKFAHSQLTLLTTTLTREAFSNLYPGPWTFLDAVGSHKLLRNSRGKCDIRALSHSAKKNSLSDVKKNFFFTQKVEFSLLFRVKII